MAQSIVGVNAAGEGVKKVLPVKWPVGRSTRSGWPSLCGRRNHRENLACPPGRAPVALPVSADQRNLSKVAPEELEYAPAMSGVYLLEVMQIGVLGDTSKAKEEDVLPHPLNVIPGQLGDWRTVGKPADRRIHRLIMDVRKLHSRESAVVRAGSLTPSRIVDQ